MSKGLILIVDDTPSNLQVLAGILEENGYDVGFAINGTQALDSLSNTLPDLVLLDIMMPDIDGIEVCRRIKANPITKDVPIIFLSAKSKKEDIVIGFEEGGADYVTKPFSAAELIARVNTQIGLKRATEELRVLNANKDKFFSIIAHDLKGPFQGLLGLTEMLQDNFDRLSDEQKTTFIEDIHTSANKFYSMLDNLLMWARVQMGRAKPDKISFRLNDILNDILDIMKHNALNKYISLVNEIEDSIVVFGDKNLANRILHNLISNSIKFSNNGGFVKSSVKLVGSTYEISVSDNGIGIKPESLKRMFLIGENISTQGTSGEVGTGLGLILCKDLAELNGGKIFVESKVGEGTKFTFTLPKSSI